MFAAALMLIAAVTTWWLAPPGNSAAKPRIVVETSARTFCGELISATDQEVRVAVDGDSRSRVISFDDVESMRMTSEC